MKTLIVFAFVIASPALAADGKVPRSSLAKMGLSGMRQMTDQDGLSIRGQAVVDSLQAAAIVRQTTTTGRPVADSLSSNKFNAMSSGQRDRL